MMLNSVDANMMADPKRMGIVMREWEGCFEGLLKSLYNDMRVLSSNSKQVDGKRFYIECYDKRTNGQGMSLRWRAVDLGGHKHVLWDSVQKNLNNMPKTMSDWYYQSNKRMQWLNILDKTIRGLIKQTDRINSYNREQQ